MYSHCGASIVNQWILLTAAHCFDQCTSATQSIVSVGHEHHAYGTNYSAFNFKVHQDYQQENLINDIALVKTKQQIRLSEKVSRVSLMRKPPYAKEALIAGWGFTDEDQQQMSEVLKIMPQQVKSHKSCLLLLNRMMPGTICAISKNMDEYVAKGDSGSALVVRGYIQIGIVSYRELYYYNVVVYTDVGYFYKWIMLNVKDLFCFH